MKTIYLNMKSNWGTETVDQLTREPGQSLRDFNRYVNQMVKEYQIAGINVYKSQRSSL